MKKVRLLLAPVPPAPPLCSHTVFVFSSSCSLHNARPLHCTTCRHHCKANLTAQNLEKACKEMGAQVIITVNRDPGVTGNFEVCVQSELVHSKRTLGACRVLCTVSCTGALQTDARCVSCRGDTRGCSCGHSLILPDPIHSHPYDDVLTS